MKRCPKCNLQYDDSLRYCLEDGVELLLIGPAPTAAPETLVLPKEEASQPTITQAARPEVPPPQQSSRPVGGSNDPPRRDVPESSGSGGTTIIIGILLALSLLLIVLGFAVNGSGFARRTPMVLFCLIGTIFALIKAKRHPRASVMTALALSVYFLGEFGYVVMIYGMSRWVGSSTFVGAHIDAIYRTMYMLNDFLYAAAIALLVGAAFAGRAVRPDANN